jgi:hypothetical protein
MISKEWKVIAMGLVAVISLTACPQNKKKSKDANSPHRGIWINAEAYQNLRGIQMGGRPDQLCQSIVMHRNRLGITRNFATGELTLDAVVVHGNGDVFRYSAYQNSASHGYRNPQHRLGRIVGTSFTRNGYGGMNSGSPFDRTQGLVFLERDVLSVSSGGGPGQYMASESYVRARSVAELEQMSALIAPCSTWFTGGGHNGGRYQGAPQQQGAVIIAPGAQCPQGIQCQVQQPMPQQPQGPHVGPPGQQWPQQQQPQQQPMDPNFK